MRPDMIVLPEPNIDDGLCLVDCAEPLSIEHFGPQCAVEAFVISILPRAARIYLYRFDTRFGEPVL